MAFQVGQKRFSGSGCVTRISPTLSYQEPQTSSSGSNSASSFKDVLITFDATLSKGKDYYLYIKIPRDMNYDMSFNIKLIKNKNNTRQVYQYLKQVSVVRGGTGANAHDVALYENQDGDIVAGIVQPKPSGNGVSGNIYSTQNSDGTYTYYTYGKNGYVRTSNVNATQMIESWKTEQGTTFGTFELVFRPVEDGFTGILVEMVRSAIDYSIQRNSGASIEFGRYVDISKTEVRMYSITNLVDSIHQKGSLSRVGVWGRPGLIMAINGEEIRVGPSGFYEEDVVPIESIGIVSETNDFANGNWTMDYTYDTEEEIDG